MKDIIKRLVPYKPAAYAKLRAKAKEKGIPAERLAQIYIEEGICWNDTPKPLH